MIPLIAAVSRGRNRFGGDHDGGGGDDPPPPQTVVEVSPASFMVDVGDTVQLTAHVTNPVGATTWQSSAPAVATVSGSGLVTGVGEGTVTITAWNNGVADTASGEVHELSVDPPIPEVRGWGILGDSNSDEYGGSDNRGSGTPYASVILNWTELIAQPRSGQSRVPTHSAGLDLGPWGSRSEPRRTGFAYNWARSGAVAQDVIDSQLPGVVSQIQAGDVTHVAIETPQNDWHLLNNPVVAAIYNSPDGGATTSTGVSVASLVSAYVSRIQTCIDGVLGAGAAGVVVLTVSDPMAFPGIFGQFPNETRRGYVSAAIASVRSQLVAYVGTVNAAAGHTVVVEETWDRGVNPEIFSTYSSANGGTLEALGLTIGAWYAPDSNPYYMLQDASAPHQSTLINGITANAFINAANQLPGVDIQPFTTAEIIANAGIEDPTTPELGTPSNLSATPGDSQVSLSWTPAANATSHQPQRRAGTSGTWQNAGAQMGGSASSRIVTGLTNNQLYQFRVQASDGSSTTTSSVVGATPNVPSTEHPNEPVGFSPITERSFSARSESGWGSGRDGQGASPMTFHIVDDPTAPRSPGSVGECRTPAGWTGAGSSSRAVDLGFSGWSSGHIYLRLWLKYSDPYFNHSLAGVSKIFYITDTTTGNDGDPLFLAVAGGGNSLMRFQVRTQGAGSISGSPGNFNFRHERRTGDYWVNELTGISDAQAEIVRGQWHDIEIILRCNSAGQQNGEVHVWKDGTKIIQYTSCVLVGNNSKRTLDTIRLHPIYGGASGSTPPPTQQSIFIDHLYLSGA